MDGGEQLGTRLFFLDGVSTVDEDEETYQLYDPVFPSPRISTYNTKNNLTFMGPCIVRIF